GLKMLGLPGLLGCGSVAVCDRRTGLKIPTVARYKKPESRLMQLRANHDHLIRGCAGVGS
ncbi:MAG: hypothetical protein AAFZ80_14745, partial [Cyanobacteria bacterium P01_A01_bin.105]